MTALAPSGEQVELRHGDWRAVTVQVGAGLRLLEHAGEPVIAGYDEDAVCDGARGQVLVPWPNRLRDGRWSWQGHELQCALTEPGQHNAIHGLVRWAPGRLVQRSDAAAIWEIDTFPQPGWLWALTTRVGYALDDAGLTVTMQVTNRSATEAPVAVGAHPYLVAGHGLVDGWQLGIPASRWLPTGEQQIPTGAVDPVDGTAYDRRTPAPIGAVAFDHAFTDIDRDPDGRWRVRVAGPHRSVVLWADGAFGYLQVFTGDALHDEHRRRTAVAVEPMTAPPNALATGTDLVVLASGASWTGNWGIEVG